MKTKAIILNSAEHSRVKFETSITNTLPDYVKGNNICTQYQDIVLFKAKEIQPSKIFMDWLKEVIENANPAKKVFVKNLVNILTQSTEKFSKKS